MIFFKLRPTNSRDGSSNKKAGSIGADLVLVSEPNKSRCKDSRWFTDARKDAAIYTMGVSSGVSDYGYGNGYVWIKTVSYKIYSCYVSPNIDLQAYERIIEEISTDVLSNRRDTKIVLTGNFNAKSPVWGGQVAEDRRGEIMTTFLMATELIVVNIPGLLSGELLGRYWT